MGHSTIRYSTTRYFHDNNGNLTCNSQLINLPSGAVTTFRYNTRGQLIETEDALHQIETFTYDNNKLLFTRIDSILEPRRLSTKNWRKVHKHGCFNRFSKASTANASKCTSKCIRACWRRCEKRRIV